MTPSSELTRLYPDIPLPSPLTIGPGGFQVSPFFNGATTTESVNFAYSGAQTGLFGFDPEFGEDIPGMLRQVLWFLNDHQQFDQAADPNALYVLSAGSNNYFAEEPLNPQTAVQQIALSVRALYERGARQFVVTDVADLGQFPRALGWAPEEAEALTALSKEHRELLGAKLED